MPGEGVCRSCHDHPTPPTSFPAQSLTAYRVLSSRAPHSVNLLADQCENPSRTSRSSTECAQDTRTVSRATQRSCGEAAGDAETPPGRWVVTSGRAEEEHRKAGELIFTQFIRILFKCSSGNGHTPPVRWGRHTPVPIKPGLPTPGVSSSTL